MKFNITSVYYALLSHVKNLEEIGVNPVYNKPLLLKLCQHFHLKKGEIRNFRTNLYFAWNDNRNEFKTKIINALSLPKKSPNVHLTAKSNSFSSVSNNEECHLIKSMSSMSMELKENNDNDTSDTAGNIKLLKNIYLYIDSIRVYSTKIVNDDHLSPELIHYYLRDQLSPKLDISCVIIFKGIKFGKNETFRDYAYCKQPECHIKFKFLGQMTGLKTIIHVYSTESSEKHTLPLSYQLRGIRPAKVQRCLRYTKPSTFHKESVNNMDPNLAEKSKNYKFTHSRKVLSTAKTEYKTRNDCHSNDVADIAIKSTKSDHPYIRQFTSPFTVYLGTIKQVQLLKTHKNLTIYFDATGSVVRKPYAESKRIYYYAGVVNIQNKIYPVLELITNNHTALSISACLKYFKDFWTENKVPWPCFGAAITDWSWASINAILNGWNNLTVSDYLKLTYDVIFSNKTLPTDITPLFTCYAHFMKMISRRLKAKGVKKHQSKIFLEAIATIVHCQDLNLLSKLIESLLTILLLPYETKKYTTALQYLSTNTTDTDISDISDDDPDNSKLPAEEEKSEDEKKKTNAILQSSPFYLHFLVIKKNIETIILNSDTNSKKTNIYQSTPAAKYFMEKLIPVLPFWSVLISKKHHCNSTVENHFKNTKIEDLGKMKAGQFIDNLFNSLNAAYIQLNLKEPIVIRRKRSKPVNEPDNLLSEKSWKPNLEVKKKRSTYYESKNIQQALHNSTNSSIQLNANFTVKNANYYYAPTAPRIYFVLFTKNVNDDTQFVYLFGEDYNSLYNNSWITNGLIDYFAHLAISESPSYATTAYVCCELSISILIKNCKDVGHQFFSELRRCWTDKTAILFPTNLNNSHWVLFYADITNGHIYYMDPIAVGTDVPKNFINNFSHCYRRVFPENKVSWVSRKNNYPTQQDTFNCGIFVIHFIIEISKMKLKDISAEINPLNIRKNLKTQCLDKSLHCINQCLACGNAEIRRNPGMIQCHTCTRWCHYTCINNYSISFEDMTSNFFLYNCDLCCNYLSSNS